MYNYIILKLFISYYNTYKHIIWNRITFAIGILGKKLSSIPFEEPTNLSLGANTERWEENVNKTKSLLNVEIN